MRLQKFSRTLRAVLTGLVLFGILAATAGCSNRQSAEKGKERIPVAVAEAVQGRLNRGELLTGKVVAAVELTLAPKLSGRVGAVPVDVGEQVRRGQVVLELDAPEIEAALRQAEAAVRVAEAGVNQAALGVERARAALEQAQENYRLAEANYNRGKLLLEQEAISPADFEARFEQPYVNAAGALKTAEAAYKQAVDQKENVVPAQLEQARAALAAARANAANMLVTAPVSGTVAARNVDPGELVSPQTPALTVVNIDTVVVEAGASDRQVNRLKPGREVKVRVAAVRDTPFVGRVASVSPAADPRTKTYAVKVELENPGHLIKPGMLAEIDLSAGTEGVLVPCDAVVHQNHTPVVFVVRGDKAVLRRVETGDTDGRSVIIRKGVAPGDRVVVAGQDRLADGVPVAVTET
ncbi:MAG: efflux RND transporter periplasmic adaptor subunit [Bacillota bacterium]